MIMFLFIFFTAFFNSLSGLILMHTENRHLSVALMVLLSKSENSFLLRNIVTFAITSIFLICTIPGLPIIITLLYYKKLKK